LGNGEALTEDLESEGHEDSVDQEEVTEETPHLLSEDLPTDHSVFEKE
jgi:hypothetical protein